MQHIQTTLVASTADTYSCSIAESRFRESQGNHGETAKGAPRIPEITVEQESEVNYFKHTQWYDPNPALQLPISRLPGPQMAPVSSHPAQTTQSEPLFSPRISLTPPQSP
jgi:hypothetical protein